MKWVVIVGGLLVCCWIGFVVWFYNNKDPFGFLVTNHKDQICNYSKVEGLIMLTFQTSSKDQT